jgi:Tol biopolymer transport system component
MIIPAIGGAERRLFSKRQRIPSLLAWTADGKALLYSDRIRDDPSAPAAIYEWSLSSGEARKLTSPPDTGGDVAPAVSPDGRRVVYQRIANTSARELRLLTSNGDDRKLASGTFAGAAWLSNTELVFASSMMYGEYQQGVNRLWRLHIGDGAAISKPRWIQAAGDDVMLPTIGGESSRSMRLLFQKFTRDSNLWRCDLQNGVVSGLRRVAVSTRQEFAAQLSPKGDRIVFLSDRTGNQELWVADAEGGHELQLTYFKDAVVNLPSWSPDGSQILFNSRKGSDNNDVFVVAADGGSPRRLTSDKANEAWASWSRDGRWIYFSSDRSGLEQIWRMSPTGRDVKQLTKADGIKPVDFANGRIVFYRPTDRHIYTVSVEGGDETPLIGPTTADWTTTGDGLLLFDPPRGSNSRTLKLYRFAEKRTDVITEIDLSPAGPALEISASRDGRRLVFTAIERVNVDLAMLDHYH